MGASPTGWLQGYLLTCRDSSTRFFKEAMEEKAETIERMAGEIEAETQNVARLRRRSPPTPLGTVMKSWKSAQPS